MTLPLTNSIVVVGCDSRPYPEEVLTKMLNDAFHSGRIKLFVSFHNAPCISHSMYADDLIIFLATDKKSIKEVRSVLKAYCNAFGQQISVEKSKIYHSPKVSKKNKKRIEFMMDMDTGNYPFHYLGCSIFPGRIKVSYFDYLIQKIEKKLSGWMGKLLSYGGRLQLINSVLNMIPLHSMDIYDVPVTILNKIDRILCRFFWGGIDGKRKKSWVAWKNICTDKSSGGLGVRRLRDVMKALHIKMG